MNGRRGVQYLHDNAPVSLFVLPPRFWPAVGREIRHRGIEFRALEVGGRRVIAWNHAPGVLSARVRRRPSR